MITTMDVIFLLRVKQRKKRLNITVYCRVTTSGPRAEFSTGIKLINTDLWDPATGMFKGDEIIKDPDTQTERIIPADPLAITYNKRLNIIRSELDAIQLNLHVQRLPYGPDTIINIYKGDAMPKTTFLRACSEYLAERKKLEADKKISFNTYRKDELYVDHITAFLKETNRYALLPQEFKVKVANDFRSWLNTSKTNSARHLEFYKRVLDLCITNEYIEANPLAPMKMGRDPDKEVIHLEPHEIETMLTTPFHVELLQHCAHLYLFQCGNGFSYSDIYSDQYEVVIREGSKYFSGERFKGNKSYLVPVFPLSETILNIYGGKLPYVCNQTYNKCLKQIAPMLGIKKHLTTHTARKTFSEIKDNEGWSLKSISRMLGHKSVKTTEKHYITGSTKCVINEYENRKGAA